MIHTLTSLFGCLALFAIMAAGFLMMFAPALGRQLFKNTLIAIAMFVVGSMLLQSSCGPIH